MIELFYQGKTVNPSLLPESADPRGSTRYKNVAICHEMIECKLNDTTFYNDIEDNNTFIIEDKSPEYEGYTCHIFEGTVIKEANGTYGWWRDVEQGDIKI